MDHSLCVIYPVPGSPPAEGTDVARMEQTAEEACHGGSTPSCTGTLAGVLAQQLDEFWGRISSCHLQTGGVGSAQQSSSQMPQGWVALCKLMCFTLWVRQSCPPSVPGWGSVPRCCCPSWLVAVPLSQPSPPCHRALSQQQLVGSRAEPSSTQLNPS